ncbi:hypothetical protein CH381_06055 [Leptospira sp. mixed culture ATI2-C-A1]|nr:hypothetical protein CH381_06055 [Leptospira sp. mixed culture ATI2-C-A1]
METTKIWFARAHLPSTVSFDPLIATKKTYIEGFSKKFQFCRKKILIPLTKECPFPKIHWNGGGLDTVYYAHILSIYHFKYAICFVPKHQFQNNLLRNSTKPLYFGRNALV